MGKIDDALEQFARKLDDAADRITEEIQRLESDLQEGAASPESLDRLKSSVDAIHNIVHEEVEAEPVEDEEGEEPSLFEDDEEEEEEESPGLVEELDDEEEGPKGLEI